MYPACIVNVSSNLCRYMYLICIPHVSRMYPHVQDAYILMYLICIPKCILDSFGIRIKYMQKSRYMYSLGM